LFLVFRPGPFPFVFFFFFFYNLFFNSKFLLLPYFPLIASWLLAVEVAELELGA